MVNNASHRTTFLKKLGDQYWRLFHHGDMGDYNERGVFNHQKEAINGNRHKKVLFDTDDFSLFTGVSFRPNRSCGCASPGGIETGASLEYIGGRS